MAIEEVLRYEAPSPVQARYVARDVECRGTTVPEGSIMLLLNGSANRDERRYPDGEKFDIHRGATHLSFGHGLHFCMGSALARMQARVALEEVIKRWPDWEVDYANASKAHTSPVCGDGRNCPSSPADSAATGAGSVRPGTGEPWDPQSPNPPASSPDAARKPPHRGSFRSP